MENDPTPSEESLCFAATCCRTAIALLHKHRPLKALWMALIDPQTRPEVAMLIARDPRCGLEGRTTVADGRMVNSQHKFLEFGVTPLMMACHADRPDVVEVLLSVGADVMAHNMGYTATHLAARNNSITVLKLLLDRGAAINARTHQGDSTPLCEAASGGHTDALRFLLSRGADATLSMRGGCTPLHLAVMQKAETVEVLLEDPVAGTQLEARDASQMTPLLIASSFSSTAASLVLIAHGAQVHEFGLSGDTPLHYAANRSNVVLMTALLAAGADVDEPGALHRTPLHAATIASQNMTAINLLLDEGADVKAVDARGETPVQKALWYTARREGGMRHIVDRLTPPKSVEDATPRMEL